MAKKKLVIMDEELVPTTLAIRKDKKKVSVFGIFLIIFIFAVFVAGVIYLPDIAVYVAEYLDPDVEITAGNDEEVKSDDEEEEPTEEVKEYEIATMSEIVEDNFKIYDVKVEGNILTFSIYNTSSEVINFDGLYYYINLYDSNKKLLQRIMLTDQVVLPGGISTVSYTLDDISTSVISLVVITPDEYPPVNASSTGTGTATLTCTKDYETVNYLLNNNLLYGIQDIFIVPVTDVNYNALYGTYQAEAIAYSQISGVTSTVNINSENSDLEFKTIIMLANVDVSNMSNKVVYDKDTDASVMSFELEAQGYICN